MQWLCRLWISYCHGLIGLGCQPNVTHEFDCVFEELSHPHHSIYHSVIANCNSELWHGIDADHHWIKIRSNSKPKLNDFVFFWFWVSVGLIRSASCLVVKFLVPPELDFKIRPRLWNSVEVLIQWGFQMNLNAGQW